MRKFLGGRLRPQRHHGINRSPQTEERIAANKAAAQAKRERRRQRNVRNAIRGGIVLYLPFGSP